MFVFFLAKKFHLLLLKRKLFFYFHRSPLFFFFQSTVNAPQPSKDLRCCGVHERDEWRLSGRWLLKFMHKCSAYTIHVTHQRGYFRINLISFNRLLWWGLCTSRLTQADSRHRGAAWHWSPRGLHTYASARVRVQAFTWWTRKGKGRNWKFRGGKRMQTRRRSILDCVTERPGCRIRIRISFSVVCCWRCRWT